MARTRKLGECGLDEPLLIYFQAKIRNISCKSMIVLIVAIIILLLSGELLDWRLV
mgnify:CR=1 FL=1